MNDWMDKFISRCLTDVPWGKYRQRTEKELRDHMETLRQSLSESEVLRAMGDPEKLRKEYSTAWNRRPLARAGNIAGCCMAMGVLYALTGIGAFWMFLILTDTSLDIAWISVLLCTLLFLLPASLGAYLLRYCFQEEQRPAFWVTLGLLAAWTVERVLAVLMGFYIITPTFHPIYLILSLLGSLVLGQIFGRANGRKCKLA